MVMAYILLKEFTERIMEERGSFKKLCVQDLLLMNICHRIIDMR